MFSSTELSRVKTNFLAILVPGTFVFGVMLSVYLAFTQKDPNITLSKHIKFFLKVLQAYWLLAIIFIIIGYLVGILIRSIRVNYADELSKKIFSKFDTRKSGKNLYESEFPYPVMLEKIKKGLVDFKLIRDIKLPKNDLHDVYLFWKIMICSELPEVFDYIYTMESTVRLFAGMFWAGLLGIIGSLSIFVGCIFSFDIIGVVWWKFNIYMLVISVTISIMFGGNIRRVRRQEVQAVFNAYLVLKEKKHDISKRPKAY